MTNSTSGSSNDEISAHAEQSESTTEVSSSDFDDMLASFGSATDEKPAPEEISAPAAEIRGSDIDDMLASFSEPQKTTISEKGKEQRKTPRYKVNWKAIVNSKGKGIIHGFINDISISGAAIYMEVSMPLESCELHFQIAPLTLASKPYVMAVTGRVIYSVYDGNKHRFRTAVSFIKYTQRSDQALLEERLSKHHVKIPEIDPKSRY